MQHTDTGCLQRAGRVIANGDAGIKERLVYRLGDELCNRYSAFKGLYRH